LREIGGDVQDVAKGIGLDGRIGSKFLPRYGYGGSVFSKDTQSCGVAPDNGVACEHERSLK